MQNLFEMYAKLRTQYAQYPLFREEKLNYTEVLSLAFRRAQFLKDRGYKKGDVIAILSHNSVDWAITYLACTALGLLTVLLDTNLTHALYQKYIDLVATKAIFVSDKFSHHYEHVEIFDISLKQGLATQELASSDATLTDISTLLYTSGTSAEPKVVGLTHNNIMETSKLSAQHVSANTTDVFLGILPFYHVYGLIATLMAPIAGGSSIVIQPSLKGTDILKSLNTHQITIFSAVPQVWELFIDRILNKVKTESTLKYKIFLFMLERAPSFYHVGLSFIPKKIFAPVHAAMGGHIRYLLTGGARMKRKYWLYYQHMGFALLEGYGLTETTGPMCGSRVTDPKPICVGQALPGNEIEIRNDAHGMGEIWVRGVSVMPGYYKNDKINKEVFDKDGWFNTGDVGFIDSDGDLHIRGRKKNVIVLDSGKNAYPEEIENFYLTHTQAIEEMTVYGRRINGKEVVFAVITPVEKDRNMFTEIRDILRQIDQGLPTYKRIGDFAISYEALPRTSTKKVIIREVMHNMDNGHYQETADSMLRVPQPA